MIVFRYLKSIWGSKFFRICLRQIFIGPLFAVCLYLLVSSCVPALGAEAQEAEKTSEKPTISITEDVGTAMVAEAVRVGKDFEKQARSLFERQPLAWDLETIRYLYRQVFSLPQRINDLTRYTLKESRKLGFIGSLLVLLFVGLVVYGFWGQKRLLRWIEGRVKPLGDSMPAAWQPYFKSGIRLAASVLLPLVLYGLFALIAALTAYRSSWFLLTGRLLGLWAAGVFGYYFLKESLAGTLFAPTARYGKSLFRWARLVLFYVLLTVAAFWAVEAFKIRPDILALLEFVVSVSIVLVSFQLFLRKRALMSVIPDLPYRTYQHFVKFLDTFYFPLLLVSFLSAILWCLGYKSFGRLILTKIWFTAAAFLLIMLIYHAIYKRLKEWTGRLAADDEAALTFARSLKSLLQYATIISTVLVLLNLVGVLDPIIRILSFPIFNLGGAPVSVFVLLKATVILLAFIFAANLLQAYSDYKIYPTLKIDPGLGYALNTFFKYVIIAIGFLVALRLVGINLQFLLVFAGAIGIGIGLGMQNIAANIISGFTIIFGGKIRKGDWIEIETRLGVVTDIYLRATKVQTLDNIEYLIPNSDLISKTIINYSLSSPMIRISLPVGVSYNADPRVVERILLDVAAQEPMVSNFREPTVGFVAYGDSSINFELLVWIDIRRVPRRRVRSALYFVIFDEFKKAGIEIPFPQRDIHIRSGLASPELHQ